MLVEKVAELLKTYRTTKNIPLRELEPKIIDLLGDVDCMEDIKKIFNESNMTYIMTKDKTLDWHTSDIYDSFRILNLANMN